MPRSFKLAVIAFAVALAGAALTSSGPAQAQQLDECTPKICTVGGKQGICCLGLDGDLTCTPCGGFEPDPT